MRTSRKNGGAEPSEAARAQGIPVSGIELDSKEPLADERRLVASLRQGDEKAFETVVKLHGGRLLATARRLLGCEEDARDALQEAFLTAFRRLSTFRGEARFSTWLHRILVNVALMKLRSRRRKPEESIEPLLPRFAQDGHHRHPVPAWCPQPEAELSRKETQERVRQSLRRLPDAYRAVMSLRDFEGYDTEETARALGISAGAVKIRLHRAHQALRTLLAPHFSQSSSVC